MWKLRNLTVAAVWTVFLAGTYLGWIALLVVASFHEESAAVIRLLKGAATPWVLLIPPLAVIHGYRQRYLPGFRYPPS